MNTSLKLTLPILLFLALFQSTVPPGPASPADTEDFCYQAQLHRQKLQEDETYRRASQRMEERLYTLAQRPAPWNSPSDYSTEAQRGPLVQHTLPVVVHIIHNGGGENISDARAADAIQHLNDAFANVGYYNPNTGVDTEIAFCLARRDPQGNATTGINRVQSTLTDLNSGTDDQALKDLSRWNPTQYINVWVVREICSNNGCGIAGYAYLPGAHGMSYDGIVLEAAYMGSNPTNSTVLVHEMGHYLGLYHTFEGGCPNGDCQQQGDRICDTPPDNTTARTPCSADINSCDTDEDDLSANNPFRPVAQGGLGDQADQKENYMDYSRLECYDRFSQGQKQRMLSVAETIRHSLLESSACLAPCLAAPVPAFTANALSVLVGESVVFTNTSTGAAGYEWRVDGELFSSSANAAYTFAEAGTFTISLTAISGLGNCLPQDTSLEIEVICPVESSFLPGDITLAAGETTTFTYTGSNANHFSWLLDGQAVGPGGAFTLEASEPGFFSLCLEAGNGLCTTVSCVEVEATGLSCETTYALALGLEGKTEKGTALLPARDGGFYLGGSIGTDALLLKFDENDNLLWQKRFSVSLQEELITQLVEDGNHLAGIATVDSTWSYCFRYNLDTESLEWVSRFEEPAPIKLSALLLPPGQAQYIALGEATETGSGTAALAWIAIGRQSGAVLQLKNYFPEGRNATVSDAFIFGDEVFCTGSYQVSNGIARIRPAITQFNLQGDEEWGRVYLRPSTYPALLYARAIIPDGEELVAIGDGTSLGISDNHVAYVFKTTAEGALLWARRFDGIAAFRAIHRLGDGYLLIEDGGSNRIIKIDKSGNLRWGRTLADNLSAEITRYHHSSFIRRGYLYLAGSTTEEHFEGIFLAKIPVDDEVLSDNALCLLDSVRNLSVSLASPPYEAEHALTLEESPLSNSPATALAFDVPLQPDTLCHISCFERCHNGRDDDRNGAADCEDEACGCSGCAPTFAKALGADSDTIGVASMILSPDGYIYLGGYDGGQAMIARMNPEGDILWWRTFDCSPGPDRITHLQLDDEGMLFGINRGEDTGLGDLTSVANAFRYNPESGAFLWVSDNFKQTLLASIILNPVTGDYLACGAKEGISFLGDYAENPFLVELERNNGDILWSKTVDNSNFIYGHSFSSLEVAGGLIHCTHGKIYNGNLSNGGSSITTFEQGGGNARNRQYSLGNSTYSVTALTADENQLVAAYQNSWLTSNISSVTGLFKTRADGSLAWIRQYRLEGYAYLQAGSSLLKTPDGYLLYGIGYREPALTTDLLLIKTNHTGEVLWAMAYGRGGLEDVHPNAGPSLVVQSGESIYLAGRMLTNNGSEQALILRCKADGTLENADCGFARPVPASTLGLAPVSTENPWDFQDWNEASPSGSFQENLALLPENAFLCEPLPCLDTCYYDFTVQVDSTTCAGDSMAVKLQICNTGSTAYTGSLPLTIYPGNPTADSATTRLNTFVIPSPILDSGACQNLNLFLPFTTHSLFVIVNDDGSQSPPFSLETDFPLNELEECSYTNNIDSFSYQGASPLLYLGPDTSVCENSVFLLDAGPGFASYRWQDGFPERTYTAPEPGMYWVEVTNSCGDIARDSIIIEVDTVIAINLSANTTDICIGDTIQFSIPEVEGYSYEWSPAQGLSCTNCINNTARPLESTTYSILATGPNGCISADTLRIQVEGCGRLLDTAICRGSALRIGDRLLYPGQVGSVQFAPDSILYLRVAALDTFYSRLDTSLCQEQSLLYEGMELWPGQTERFTFTARNGCDSTVEFNVLPLDPISANIIATDISCAGFQDGMIIVESPAGGQPPYRYRLDGASSQPDGVFTGLPAGSYTVFIRDGQGCELSREIQLKEPPPLQLALPEDQTLKLGDSLRLTPFITGATELAYAWSPTAGLSCAACREPVAAPLESTLYRLDIVDENGCAASDDILVLVDKTAPVYIPNAFSPNGDGHNDRLQVFPGPAVERMLSFRVFSRWGELIFEEMDTRTGAPIGWDGTFYGQPMAGGVYVYYAELALKNGRSVGVQGEVVLMR